MSNNPKSVPKNKRGETGSPAGSRPSKNVIEIVSATRLSESDFWSKSALGLSLKRHVGQDARLSVNIAFENTRGLSEIFNGGIAQADDDAILVFIHDDVWIDEANFGDVVIAGLGRFDVIGVAGNRRRVPNQPGWAFIDRQFTWDDKSNLSGRVAHGKDACGPVSDFGAVPAECELLDGVFLAVRKRSLKQHGVMFDARFDFHFYDMDFCRSARKAGLRLGTWPVELTHQSGGAFGSPQWKAMYRQYLRKWDEPLANDDAAFLSPADREMQQAVNELLSIALKQESLDQVALAENLYREILKIQPRNAEANHRLGRIERNLKGVLAALPRLEIAVMEQPGSEQFWVSYIDALIQTGAADIVTDALALGQQHGLGREAAQALAAKLSKKVDTEKAVRQESDAASLGIHIYQIYYSEQTQRDNDGGFIGLDNLARPDWREYWPIRNYLQGNRLNEDDYYGFFSPKFKSQTDLDSAAVHEYVRTHADKADVLLFSPFFEQGAFYLNMFEQGAAEHPGIGAVFRGCAGMIAPDENLATLVMDSRNTVYCNYIVAKPAFWNAWMEKCESIFAIAEENKTALAGSLNASTDDGVAPNKVFVIERIASFLLATQRHWRVKAYNSTLLPYAKGNFAKYRHELLLMDALKIASVEQGYPEYLATFSEVRQSVMADILLSEGV
ncbi:MAG: glycosyltransferase [Gallionella sp.]